MSQPPVDPLARLQPVFDYHQATKHRFEAYAQGPGYLDWATQPNPFRRYEGARLILLPLVPPTAEPRYDAVFDAAQAPTPAPVNRNSIAQLFYDALAVSAWKSTGDSRWALRVNPSSGNLHPTEGYLVCGPIDGLCERPMVCHYAPEEHALEVRAEFDAGLWKALSDGFPTHTFFVALTSIHWREAWKYGRRAYRYCMHDAGHALAAIALAARALGWQARLLDEPGTDELAQLLGTAGEHGAEGEEPDALLACMPTCAPRVPADLPAAALAACTALEWRGRPNRLSPSQRDWGLQAIAAAVRKPPGGGAYAVYEQATQHWPLEQREGSLRALIHRRRSAVAMDARTALPRDAFYRMLYRTLAMPGTAPFDTLPWRPHIHLALFVHRVSDLPAGLYLLVRDPAQSEHLRQACTRMGPWRGPPGCPPQLPLYAMWEGDARAAARAIGCHQAIASDGCFSLAMLAEYQEPLEKQGPWFYPRLYWEAGLIGQTLYLEAEAAGLRGTGIGCFFDDAMHELLGLQDRSFQDLYHFTVGGAVDDARLTTWPAYAPERRRPPSPSDPA